MQMISKKKLFWIIFASVLLAIAFCCRWVNYYPLFIKEESAVYVLWPVLKIIIRNVIHISLLIAWCISIRSRILEKRIRNLVLSVGYLIMLWFVIRICKWDFVMSYEDPLVRYLWYAFYIPIILIPVQGIFIAVLAGRPENYQFPVWMKCMYIPAFLLILLIFTNDLHFLMFSFPEGMTLFNLIYKHEPLYALVILWVMVLALVYMNILIRKSRAARTKKYHKYPFVFIGCFIAVGVIHTLQLIQLDQTLLNCLLIILLLERQMELGMIRTNSNYEELFRKSNIAALIVNSSYEPVYSSASAVEMNKSMIGPDLKEPILDGDWLIQSSPVSGGYVFWQNNVKEINNILEELRDTSEQLEEAYELQKTEMDLKEQQLQTEEKSRLYDRIAREVSPQLTTVENLLLEAEKYPEKVNRLLAKVCVIGAYVKRLSNLILIGEEQKMITAGELESCLRESMDNLRLADVLTFLDSRCEDTLPVKNAKEVYRTFEKIVEMLIDKMNAMVVSLKSKEGRVFMRIQIGCSEEILQAEFQEIRLQGGTMVVDIQEEDIVIDLIMEKGGA